MKKLSLFLLFALPIFSQMKVLVFAGSLREDSYNKKLAKEAAAVFRKSGADVTYVDLKNYSIPFYDGDLEKNQGMPKNAKKLQDLFVQSDTIVIATPEYNGSIPAVLKNAIDWVSRTEDGNFTTAAFEGKKCILMSASPGKSGGANALLHLSDIVERLGAEVYESTYSLPLAHTALAKDSITSIQKDLQAQLEPILKSSINP